MNNQQYADLIEPLMVWLLRRINDVLYNPENLRVPKHILIEEIFSSMKNRHCLKRPWLRSRQFARTSVASP